MKLNSRALFFIIVTFSFGYLAGYLTLYWMSPSFHKALILYDGKKDYMTNPEAMRRAHRSVTNYAKPRMDQSILTNGYSYLLVLYYFEQMNNAMKNLLHLGPIAMNLDLKIVEPFVVHSRLYGLPDMLPAGEVTGSFYSLHTLFNIDSINQSLNTYANASLASFEEFVHNAPRNVTVVYFIHKEHYRPRTFRLSYHYLRILRLVSEAKTPVIDCSNEIAHEEQIYGGLLDALLNITTKYGVGNFRITKFVCAAGEKDTTTNQLREQLGSERKTVIFPEWRGCGYRNCNFNMRRKHLSHNRPKLLYTLRGEKESPLNLSYASSDLVIETANLFINKRLNLNKKSYISVYMRTEKLLKRNGTFYIDKNYLKCCVSTLQKVLAGVKKRFKLSNVLLITDLGRYGSDSCTGDCQLAGASILKDVEKRTKLKMFDYVPNITPQKIDNGGFAAMVEMEMLAGGKKLITVGAGMFKEQVTRLHEKKTIHSNAYGICKEMDINVLHDFAASFPTHCG